MDKKLNESTLESRISSVLGKIFPTYKEQKIKQQGSFSIKFGHHDVLFKKGSNNINSTSRAIYDILLTTEDEKTNLILLELKREGLKLKPQDVEQGLSYARLIHPIPPITLISNGLNHLFYNTYTKQEIDIKSIDMGFINTMVDNGFKLAINDFKNTIDILLDKNPTVFVEVLNNISEKNFELLKGKIEDYTKSICESFIIKRDVIEELNKVKKTNKLIGIIGHAMSGKTNILFDYYKTYANQKNIILYIDCQSKKSSILQRVANHLTKKLRYAINISKVRDWLINSSYLESIESFSILLDNFLPSITQKLQEEIIELIDLFEDSKHTIIFTVDLINYINLTKDPLRNYSNFLGNNTHIIEIKELNIEEHFRGTQLFYNYCNARFQKGAYYAFEYREPRILRLIAANLFQEQNKLKSGQFQIIPAVPDFQLLSILAKNKTFNSSLRKIFKKLAKAYIADRDNIIKNIELNLAAMRGGISLDSVEKEFGNQLDSVLKSGFVTKYEVSDDNIIIYPKLPELISFYSIEYISELIISEKHSTLEEVKKQFEKLCTPFINFDIVGSAVLVSILKKGYNQLFFNLIEYYMDSPPRKEKNSKETKVMVLLNDRTQVNIEFEGDNFEENMISNFFPYQVLSQLAGYPMKVNRPGEEDSFYLQLLFNIANSKTFLGRNSNFSIENMPSYESFDFEGNGYATSSDNGIIEPIVQSLQKCFRYNPELIEILYLNAIEHEQFTIFWRIYLAIKNETESINGQPSKAAKKFMKIFDVEFPKLFAKIQEKLENKKSSSPDV